MQKLLAYGPSLHGAPIETLHTVRIDCKRLRYALEFLRETLSPQAEAAIEDFKHAQDHLGEMNDAYVAGEDLRKLMEKVAVRNGRRALPGRSRGSACRIPRVLR